MTGSAGWPSRFHAGRRPDRPRRSRGPAAHGEPSLAGDLLVVASLFTALAWILLSKKLMLTHSPPVVTAYTILSGTLMLALCGSGPLDAEPCSLITRPAAAVCPREPHRLGRLAISGLLCTATTTLLWNWGIHHVPASRAGVFLNIEPALGSWLGVQLLGEHLGPYAWAGGALILAAAITSTARGTQPNPAIILRAVPSDLCHSTSPHPADAIDHRTNSGGQFMA